MELDQVTQLKLYDHMLLARVLDDILSQPRILGNPFYIGSAFEEPTAVIGMLMNAGRGVEHDVFATHYRSLPILLGMGLDPVAVMRQAAMRDTDPASRGRQMVSHFSEPDLNVVPMSSCVTVQAGKGTATAHIQKIHAQNPALTLIHLGDAMCAEGDFWLMMQEIALYQLPVVVLISNNAGGIHTPYAQGSAAPCQSAWGVGVQIATSSYPNDEHLHKYVQSYAPTLPIPDVKYVASPREGWKIVDGHDTLSLARAAQVAFDYVRTQRKPYILEYRSERGRHHSSSSNPSGQILADIQAQDPLTYFEQHLMAQGWLTAEQISAKHQQTRDRLMEQVAQVLQEPAAENWDSGLYVEAGGGI